MKQDFRPELHFTPQKGWINDPNGLLYENGRYHLFAQHHPDSNQWGPMHWLHATGTDLLHWEEQGIALAPDELGTMFSGSAAMLQDGRMVLMYTADGEMEQQCVAFSTDGISFEKSALNPVIPTTGIRDFRDPKIFWNEKYSCWSVAIAMMEQILFYRTEDFLHFTLTGSFALANEDFGFGFECPDLFALTAPNGEQYWVLTASMMFHQPEYGCRMQYLIGSFDGDTFEQTQKSGKPLRMDVGYDCYAGVSFGGAADCLWMGWMTASSCPLPSKTFCGAMTLARHWTLVDTPNGLRVAQKCALEHAKTKPYSNRSALPKGAFVVTVHAQGVFELRLCEKQQPLLTIGLDAENKLYTARAKSTLFCEESTYNDDNRRWTQIPREYTGELVLQMVCDAPCIECFADGGVYAHALLVYPMEGFSEYELEGQAAVVMEELEG